MNNDKPFVSLAIIVNQYDEVLAVSRKDDHTDFGFPGGKCEQIGVTDRQLQLHADDYETSIETLIREVYEETGLRVHESSIKFLTEVVDNNGYLCKVFVCDYMTPDIGSYLDPPLVPGKLTDNGIVEWMNWREFLNSSKSHSDFNRNIYKEYNTFVDNAPIVRFNHYINERSNEAYEVLHIIDCWVVVQSTFNERPLVIPFRYMEDSVKLIPKIKFMYLGMRVVDMDVNPHNYSLASRAKAFAIGAHNEVNQMYDGVPYSEHLCDAVDVFEEFKHLIPREDHDLVESGIYTHDGIEDAQKTFNDVKLKLSEPVAELAYALTNEKGKNRKQRASAKYYNELKVEKYGEFAKLCDRIANVRRGSKSGKMIDGYRKEQVSFKDQLQNNPLYLPMWDCLDELLKTK